MISATPKPVLRGERFGSIVACLPLSHTDLGRVWLCKCDCGAWCERLGVRLRVSQRAGQDSACSMCNRKHGGSWASSHALFLEALKGMWADQHTLWSTDAEERLANDTWKDLLEEFGPVVDELQRFLSAHPFHHVAVAV